MSDPKPRMSRPAIERVLDRIEMIPIAGCWIFMGSTNSFGHGTVQLGRRGAGRDNAHRVSFEHFVGEIPDGLVVRHRCDVPSCVNPAHLELGTPADNARDCRERGRTSTATDDDDPSAIIAEIAKGRLGGRS